jgi:2-oxo-hept-3-ene-1,7-dioate hydratase/2-keto-4-pentenoate hydratase
MGERSKKVTGGHQGNMGMLTDKQVQDTASSIFEAEKTRSWVAPVSNRFANADVADAYRVAIAVRNLKIADGRTVRGHKIGLTSKAMREILGSTEPDYGFLYDDWFVPEGSTIEMSRLNRPMVEVEIAFVMGSALSGPSANAADVIRATDFVLPMLEIVDSRFNTRGNNALIDSISDGAWCGFVVLGGNPAKLTDIDVRTMSASLSINGEVQQTGSARAVMGNPINSVAWLANKLHEFEVSIQPGDVIMSGSFIRAMPFGAGDTLLALFDELGEVSLSVARA